MSSTGAASGALALARRVSVRHLITLALVTAMGAAIGVVSVALTTSERVTATSTVQLGAPPDVNALLFGEPAKGSDVEAIVASQIAVMQGDRLAAEVAAALKVSTAELPSYTVTQVGSAPLLEIATSSSTSTQARRVTQEIATTYVQQRRSETEQALASATRALDTSIAAAASARQNTDVLQAARSRVALAGQQIDAVALVLVPAQVAPARLLPTRVGLGLIAGLLGAVAALSLSLLLRSRDSGVQEKDLQRLSARVLEPELSGRSPGMLSILPTAGYWNRQAVLLVNQLDPRSQWLVAGLSDRAPVQSVAALLARRTGAAGSPPPVVVQDVALAQTLDLFAAGPQNGTPRRGVLLVPARSVASSDVVGAVNAMRAAGAQDVCIILARDGDPGRAKSP